MNTSNSKNRDFKEEPVFTKAELIEYTLILMGVFLTFMTSLVNFLLFHTIAELISIIISVSVFLIGWNSRKYMKSSFFLLLGISFLFMGVIDLLHTLSYKDMGIFLENDANLPTQLWISARYLQAISFLLAIVLINKRLNPDFLLTIYLIICSIILFTIFQGIFPDCLIDDSRLTPFKIYSEYIIVIILFISASLIFIKRNEFDRKVFILIIMSILATIISELSFTLYVSVSDLPNIFGHVFKILASYFVYKAIIETGFESPVRLLFRKIKVSEEKYRKLIEDSNEGVWVINKSAITTLVNTSMAKILGYEVNEMLGKSLYDFMDKEGRKIAEVYFERRRRGIKEEHTFRFVHKNGNRVYTSLNTSPITDENGNFAGAMAFISDITQQKLAQEKIEDMARFPLENPNPVLRVSSKYVLLANKICQDIFNVSEGSDIPESLKEDILICLERREGKEIELKIQDRVYNFFIVPIKDAGYVNIYGMDITARKKAEEDLERFVSTVSHELRTPISVLITSYDFIDHHSEKITPDVQERLESGIKKNVFLLRELVEDLLMLSRLDEKKVELEFEEYYPYDIVREILILMEPIGEERKITFKVNIDEQLSLIGDTKRITQVFRILIDNAIKYSKEGSEIEVGEINNYQGKYNEALEEGILFYVKDFGIGIHNDDLSHVFERFYRSENVSNIPGSGLGLSIAKEIVALHNGNIFVESDFGKQTTVYFFLPRIEKKL